MPSLETGSVIGGRYRLERALARGGMGSVWVARHLQLDVDVAIKFIAPEHAEHPEVRVRFEREARASAQLKSPYAVLMHDYGIEGDTPYIVMELLDGETLEARLSREGRLTPAAMLPIVTQVCKALRRAQEIALIHRDLKPPNIFIARQDGEEIVKILDFGIAKPTSLGRAEKVTKTGTVIGTPHYMSPEQVRCRKLDHRSDLWSVGVVVFQCLTGRLPFGSQEFGDVLVEICTDPVPIASQVAPDLGPQVDSFLSRALTRDPDKRFQSADELADAFAAVAGANVGVSPAPVSMLDDVTLVRRASTGHMGPSRRTGILLAVVASAATLGVVAMIVIRAVASDDGATSDRRALPAPPSSAAPSATSQQVRKGGR